ncbi:AraC family transcriptional regulator [Halioxenophilus aromaticivorans]|uniref:AraC family transcriptional regulator n=2 Tax=Halioxenophilus aromaticivorans TaxID=1306992 RepID=A0AAV3TYE7_9ALTE
MFFSLETPLMSVPGSNQLRASNLAHYPELIARLGGDSRHILDHHGISPDNIGEDDEFLDCKTFVDLLEYSATSLKQPLLGLQLARLHREHAYGLVAHLCRSAPSVEQALTSFVNFLPMMHSPESDLRVVSGKEVTELRWCEKTSYGDNLQANLQGLYFNLSLISSLVGDEFSPNYLAIPRLFSADDQTVLEAELKCPVRLSQGQSSIAFSSGLLQQKPIGANRAMHSLIKAYLESLKSQHSSNVLTRVSQYIQSSASMSELSLESCADSLGISTRGLQLKLKQDDVKFSQLLQTERFKRAKLMLKDAQIAIAEVADQLGYSEHTSFDRAFKRWAGTTPQRYRAIHAVKNKSAN